MPHLLLGGLTAYLLFPLLSLTEAGQVQREAIVRTWMQALLGIINVKLRPFGEVKTGAVFYCANHISWLDIVCLRTLVGAVFIAKSEVRHWPLVGGMAEKAGTVFLRRGRQDDTGHVADRMTWMLSAGKSVMVFPEGTSTDGRLVRQFHARLYQAAIRMHGQVQAIAIRYPFGTAMNPAVPFIGDDNMARHLWRLLGENDITADLHFCPALEADRYERRALAHLTRSQILEALNLKADDMNVSTPNHLINISS